jgi:hypothetical protein
VYVGTVRVLCAFANVNAYVIQDLSGREDSFSAEPPNNRVMASEELIVTISIRYRYSIKIKHSRLDTNFVSDFRLQLHKVRNC